MSPSDPVLFREEQRFRQTWLWGLLGIGVAPSVLFVIWGLYQQLVLKKPWGDRPMSDGGLIAMAAITIGLGLGTLFLLYSARLIVSVRTEGLFLRFIPFHLREQRIDLEGVRKVESIVYSPVKEFGGWGIRYRRGAKAYNVSGDRGVRLSYDEGRILLIGSQEPDALAEAILGLLPKARTKTPEPR